MKQIIVVQILIQHSFYEVINMGGKHIKWTQDKIDFIVNQYTNQLMNTKELAKYFGCSDDTIGRRLRENNIIPHKFYEDLTGQTFGELTVIRKSEKSGRKLFWDCICSCGKELTVVGDKLRSGGQISCGHQRSKGEQKIYEILTNNNITFSLHYSFNDLRSKYKNVPYSFDFAIFNDNKLSHLIEYDGEQHFYYQENGSWNTKENYEKGQIRDTIKNNYCIEHNIPLIRIPYTHFNHIILEDLQLETSQFIFKGDD